LNIAVRRTIPDDADRLAEIQREAFLPIYEKYQDAGNPHLRGKEDILPKLLLKKRFLYFTILLDDEIVGGVLYRRIGNGLFFRELGDGEYYLQRIYIASGAQRGGVAKEAITQCEKMLTDATYFCVDFPIGEESNRKLLCAVGFKDAGKRLEAEPGLMLAFYEKHLR
jgi:hypothetical protein